MPQQQAPWLETAYGWAFGENGWNAGMDENLVKFSFMFDRNVDDVVSSLPPAVNGQAYFLTTDNRLYFAVGTTYFSTPVPKWFTVVVRSTGQTHQFNGTSLVQTDTPVQLDSRLDSVELTVSTLGTAAFQSVEFFATQTELDIAEAQAQSYTDLLRTDFENTLDTILNYGAACDGVTDDTAAAARMLAAKGFVIFPYGRVSVIKNFELTDNAKVFAYGTLKLPGGCADFDRLLYAAGRTGVYIQVAAIDGNYAGQVGAIGTHLVYLTNCPAPVVRIQSIAGHYVASDAPTPSVDGIRNSSSGAVYLYRCHRASVRIGQLSGWSREGIYLYECNFAVVGMDHAQGMYTTEYSGLQVSGNGNTVTHASVDNAGASGVGFDTTYGVLNNVRSTNTRENHGVNFGHTGLPATGSVASNIVVDGAFLHGISVGAGTQDLLLSNVSIYNAGELGVNFSDGALRGNVTSGFIEYSGQANINAFQANVQTRNVDTTRLLARSLKLTGVTGQFIEGENISAPGSTGVTGRVLNNLTGLGQRLLLSGSSGPFTVGGIVTGATSGATGTISTSIVPTEKLEAAGGKVVPEFERGGVINAGGAWVKYADGRLECQRLVNMDMTLLTTQTFTFPIAPVVSTAGGYRSLLGLGSASSLTADAAAALRVSDTAWEYTITASAGTVASEPMMLTMIARWF